MQDYPKHELLPHGLTKDELEIPYRIIEHFFSITSIVEIRQDLKAIFDTWVAGNFADRSLTKKERRDLVFMFRKVEELVEAVYCLYLLEEERWGTKPPLVSVIKAYKG